MQRLSLVLAVVLFAGVRTLLESSYIVTRPRRVAINEILVRPTEQEQ